MIKFILMIMLGSLSFIASSEELKNSIAKKQSDNELTILGVTIGKTNLNEIKTKFKTGEIYHESDAGGSLYTICLKSSNGSTIAFESSEIGGADRRVNAISVNGPESPYRLSKICEKTSLIKGKLTLHKTSLGMSPDIVKHLTGKPSKETPTSFEYRYEMSEKSSSGQVATVSTLIIEFKNSMSINFTASKTQTNLE